MSIVAAATAAQNILLNPRMHVINPFYICRNRPKTLLSNFSIPLSRVRFEDLIRSASNPRVDSFRDCSRWRLGVFGSDEGIDGPARSEGFENFSLDSFLSIIEVLCIAPCAIFSIGCALNYALWAPQKSFLVSLGNRVFVWQFVFLVVAVATSSFLRRRQWHMIYRDSYKTGNVSLNIVERIDKLEEDLKSSATIIRVLSRQLEKLGIRFRITRKAVKGPITETAALAQKTSEVTRALAMREDILEKELGEIQKVLLAMQEQQQKQLELILAIAKSGKLRESKQEPSARDQKFEIQSSVPEMVEGQQTEGAQIRRHKGTNNDRA